MSLLHKSISSRLIASSLRRGPTRAFASSAPRSEADPSTQSLAEQPDSSTAITKENVAQRQAKHQPDYSVAVDYRTSTFSPIPKRVMDGSEPGESVPAAVLSGAPVDLQARTVRIYRPTKPATQSGTWHSHHWLIDWDPLPKGHRWENPLMGWQSSADFMNGERIQFRSKEDAIQFATKQGYEYYVQEPNERRIVPKAYANNFTHSPKKLKTIRTK